MVKDVCYASLFAKEDLPLLYKLAEKVRTTHDQSLVNDFNNKCQRKFDDHNPILEVGNQQIEFLQTSKADDLVVTAGINQCIDQILGVSVVRWLYMIASDSITPVTAADTTFPGAGNVVNMSTKGWCEYASTTLRFAGIFGESIISTTVNSGGVMTGPGTGTLLNRNMFSNNPLTHTLNVSAYVISSIIEFVPVV